MGEGRVRAWVRAPAPESSACTSERRQRAEAVSRLGALWRDFERYRIDPAFGMSGWCREHADPTMTVLMSTHGPFADSRDTADGTTVPPPAVMFPDERESA